MRLSHSVCLVLALAFGGAAFLAAADPPPAPKSGPADKKAEPAPAAPPPAARPERLPGDYVILVVEKATEAVSMGAVGYWLRPEKYQELNDTIARLRQQLALRKADPPSQCKIEGKVEGNAAVLHFQFDFVTRWPDALVPLACVPGLATSASLDGHTPLLRPEPDGFLVQVEKPGEHQLSLDLVVPLVARGPGQGLELALPRAAITTLRLELPPGSKDVRLAGKPWAETLVRLKDNHLEGGLGPIDKLDLSWKGPRATAGVPLLAAEGIIRVRLEAGGLTTKAELTLRAEAGQADVWRLLVPHRAEVHVAPADEGRLARSIEAVDQAAGSLRTLRLREPSADPLRVSVTVHGPVPKPAGTVAVGPFAVPGAVHQSGTVFVSSALADLQLDLQPHAGPGALDLQRRPLTEEERNKDANLVAAFHYGNVNPAEGAATAGAGLGPWLDVSAGLLHGQLRARVNHVLSLQPDGTGALAWQSSTTVVVTAPRWAEVNQVKVQLPDGWEPLEELGGSPAGMPRVVTLKLPRGPGEGSGQATLTIAGRYADKQKSEGSAALGLPRPLGAIDQGGEVTVQVARDLEATAATAGLEVVRQSPHEQVWRFRTQPEALALTWRPYVPDVRVKSLADVDLTLRGGRVRQWIDLQLPQPPPAQVSLRVPAGITGLALKAGGTLAALEDRGAARVVHLGKPSPTEHRLALEYEFTAASPAREAAPFVVPLVYPEPMTQGESRVRLWCDAGSLPVLLDGTPWTAQPIEDVAERKILPALVARAPRADAPLSLRWGEPQGAIAVLAERALVRVRVAEDGGRRCTARYRLRQLAASHLDVELPEPVASLNLKVELDRRGVAHEVLDDAGQPSDGGRVARLRLAPELVKPGSVLELSYLILPGRPGPHGGGLSTLMTLLQPPVLRGDAGAVPTCWEVRVPPSWVALGPESGPGVERTWGRRGWLLAPRLARVPGEPDRDLAGEDSTADPGDPPAVVCWRNGPEALTLTHVPQKGWMLACSLGLLVVGLALYGLGRPAARGAAPGRGLSWALVLLALAAAAGAVLRPTVLAAVVYGCEPGAAVLLVVLLVRWLLHERYRRQIVFLPSFSRGRSGSSMLRGSSTSRQPGEPSTVDAPRTPAASAGK